MKVLFAILVIVTFLFFFACKNPTNNALSSNKEITAFGIVSPAETGIITDTNIAVPFTFTASPNNLVATFTTTGIKVFVGSTVQASGVTQNNFANPIIYTVVAEDGTTQSYTVTVSTLNDPVPFP